MNMPKKALMVLWLTATAICSHAQQTGDTTDLMAQLEQEASAKDPVNYTTAIFKTTRLINGHSIENVAKGVLDVKISHRFGTLNTGFYELFGLDNASMRMGVDYGITPYLMVGIGRSTFQKTYDGFFKLKLLRQSSGLKNMPVSLSLVSTMAVQTLRWADPDRENYFSSRLSYTHQLLVARKFSESLSLQLMPTFIHRNLAVRADEPNDLWALGIGGRQKLSKRVSVNVEYYYMLPGSKLDGTANSLSVGFDIETGGHVFQLHFTNSTAMTEKNFISETTGKWDRGDVLFGFNISRVFTIGKSKKK
jgi:opacity protein-like surface antigen